MNELFSKPRRFGRFRIASDVIIAVLEGLDTQESVSKTFAKCVVFQASFNSEHNCIEYLAISELFDEVEVGQDIPFYFIGIQANGTITARRI